MILNKAKEIINRGQNDSFLIFDPAVITKRINLWNEYLPEIDIFYAVKSNPDPVILKKMIATKNHFDCASMGEIEKVLELGCSPKNIIYANPAKSIESIVYAKQKGINLMTFDCIEEAIKMKDNNTHAEAVLRI